MPAATAPLAPLCAPLHGVHGPTALDDESIEWLQNTCSEI